jgi:hypothetical protein
LPYRSDGPSELPDWVDFGSADPQQAKTICRECTVQAECREFTDKAEAFSIVTTTLYGVWAGEDGDERVARRKREGTGRHFASYRDTERVSKLNQVTEFCALDLEIAEGQRDLDERRWRQAQIAFEVNERGTSQAAFAKMVGKSAHHISVLTRLWRYRLSAPEDTRSWSVLYRIHQEGSLKAAKESDARHDSRRRRLVLWTRTENMLDALEPEQLTPDDREHLLSIRERVDRLLDLAVAAS